MANAQSDGHSVQWLLSWPNNCSGSKANRHYSSVQKKASWQASWCCCYCCYCERCCCCPCPPSGSGTRTIHQVLSAAGVWMHPYTNKEFDSKLFIKKIKHTPPFGMPGACVCDAVAADLQEGSAAAQRQVDHCIYRTGRKLLSMRSLRFFRCAFIVSLCPTLNPLTTYTHTHPHTHPDTPLTPPAGRKSGMIWETRHSPAYYEPGDLSADIHRKLAAAHALVGEMAGGQVWRGFRKGLGVPPPLGYLVSAMC